MESWIICIPVALSVLLFGSACLIAVHERENPITGTREADFITDMKDKKQKRLETSHSVLSLRMYIALLILLPFAFGVLSYCLLKEHKPLCLLFAAVGALVPDLLILITRRKQTEQFDQRYGQALRAFSSCLRSGMTIQQSVSDVSKNDLIHETIREGFRQIDSDIRFGVPVETAFMRFAIHSGSKDAEDVASAVAMQSKVGGSEAAVIGNIAQNINERILINKEVKAMFADTNILILVMDFLPAVIVGAIYAAAPQYIAPYFESFWMTMLFIGLLAITFIGSFVARGISKRAKEG